MRPRREPTRRRPALAPEREPGAECCAAPETRPDKACPCASTRSSLLKPSPAGRAGWRRVSDRTEGRPGARRAVAWGPQQDQELK
eukprot:5014251-Lingulodinium_polyedra.AAC.1